MPVSPSSVSGISAWYFRNCQSFDGLWILKNPFCGFFKTEWIFQDFAVIRPNQTACETMWGIEILVEHFRGLIFPSTERQERFAEDWEWMPLFYLIL